MASIKFKIMSYNVFCFGGINQQERKEGKPQ